MLEKLKGLDLQKAIAMIAAGYGKTFADKSVYNKISGLDFFQKIKEKDPLAQNAFIFGLHAVTAIVDQVVDEDSPLKKMLKEIALDTGSEVARRLKNGVEVTAADPPITPEQKTLLGMLALLEPETIKVFATWVTETPLAERHAVIQRFESLSETEFTKMAGLSPETLSIVDKIFGRPKEEEKNDSFNWNVALSPLTERLKKIPKKGEDKHEIG